MRLRQIEIFYHVYRVGTISGAAQALNVSQPSVSKVLRHAEDQIGFELFQRVNGRLEPTPAAHELFRDAEDIYKQLGAFNRSLDNIRTRKSGHLKIGALPSLSLSVGPELIATMHAADPDMGFELTTLHSVEIAEALLDRRHDLCLGVEPVLHKRIANHAIGEGHFVLVSAEQLGPKAGIECLDGADFIGMSDTGPLGTMIGETLRDRGITPVEVATAHTYHVALSLVRKGVGLALTDQYTAYSHLGAGLQRCLLEDLPGFSIHASVHADHPDPKLIKQTLAQLERVVARLQAGIRRLQPEAP